MAQFSDDIFDLEDEQEMGYIYEDPFENTLNDDDYYNTDFEPMYLKKNLQKLSSDQWELISSTIYQDRRLRGK